MKLRTVFALVFLIVSSSVAHARVSVVCSLFPVYDFTRSVAGELADVKLLIPAGVDLHEYEPSPRDIITLNEADLFIYTCPELEAWAQNLPVSAKKASSSRGIQLTNNDPHIWLDLSLAQTMTVNIMEALCTADPENALDYARNAEDFCVRLGELDAGFLAMRKDKPLVFAGEFSAGYFVRRYGFEYVSAYDGENEPSLRKMAEVISYIQHTGTRFIFTDNGAVSRVTRAISEQTGAEILTFGTGHVVQDGATFLQIMADNYNHITEAMNE
ncbi:MAG: zinc ABC transporter substrate-binding protein [Synergistaceae bacterium]|nr:zinc ABC transporter substrate-binding protein [Synergistaceae bacterium]